MFYYNQYNCYKIKCFIELTETVAIQCMDIFLKMITLLEHKTNSYNKINNCTVHADEAAIGPLVVYKFIFILRVRKRRETLLSLYLSLARSAPAERDNESCFSARATSVNRYKKLPRQTQNNN